MPTTPALVGLRSSSPGALADRRGASKPLSARPGPAVVETKSASLAELDPGGEDFRLRRSATFVRGQEQPDGEYCGFLLKNQVPEKVGFVVRVAAHHADHGHILSTAGRVGNP